MRKVLKIAFAALLYFPWSPIAASANTLQGSPVTTVDFGTLPFGITVQVSAQVTFDSPLWQVISWSFGTDNFQFPFKVVSGCTSNALQCTIGVNAPTFGPASTIA